MSQFHNEETEQSGTTANLKSLRLPSKLLPLPGNTLDFRNRNTQDSPTETGHSCLFVSLRTMTSLWLVVSTKHLNTPSVGQLTNPGQSRAYFPAFDPIAQEAHDVQREQQKLCKWKVRSLQRLVSIFHQQRFAALSDVHLGVAGHQSNNARYGRPRQECNAKELRGI